MRAGIPIMAGLLKSVSASRNERMNPARTAGMTSGKVTLSKVRRVLEPRMLAASSMSADTRVSAPEISKNANG